MVISPRRATGPLDDYRDLKADRVYDYSGYSGVYQGKPEYLAQMVLSGPENQNSHRVVKQHGRYDTKYRDVESILPEREKTKGKSQVPCIRENHGRQIYPRVKAETLS